MQPSNEVQTARYRVFYLDDEQINTHLFERRFSSQFEISVFNRVEGFLEAVRHQIPDLVVLDLMMPDITGFDVLNLLRSTRRSRFVPVLILTAMEKSQSLKACFEQGADDFMLKPPDFTELSVRMESLITRYYRSREQVRQRRIDSMRRMIGGFNHEFNNHLTILQSGIELMGMNVRSDKEKERISRLLDTIQRSASLLKVLTRLVSPQHDSVDSLYLGKLLQRVQHWILGQAEDLQVEVQAHFEVPDVVQAAVSEEGLQQVLEVLIRNALESFHEIQGRVPCIEMRAKVRGSLLHMEVKDNGSGISQEMLPKVFDLFFTTKGSLGGAQSTLKRTETGIGLSLAEVIVRDSGGRIELDSQEGVGTVAEVVFPLGESLQTDRSTMALRPSQHGPVQMGILFQEGTESILLKEWLQLQGVLTLEVGEPSVQMTADLDLFFVSYPSESSQDMIRGLRESHPQIPILWLINENEIQGTETFVQECQVEVLSRPIDYRHLTQFLQRLRYSPVFSRC